MKNCRSNLVKISARWLVLYAYLALSSIVNAAGLTPAAPENLVGSIDDGVASLTWDIPQDDDSIEGYNIYINNSYSNTVFSNSFSIAVEPDTRNSFQVVAFDEVPRNFSPASQALVLPESLVPDDLTVPPSVPESLSGEIVSNQILLSWEPSTDDEAVLGYNVYRDNQYFTTVQSPSFIGDNPADEAHSWYVIAIDIRTNFSARSENITIPDPGSVDTTIPPSIPTGLVGEVATGETVDTVVFTWESSTDDQAVAGYNIFRNRMYIATRFGTQYEGTVEAGSSNSFQVGSFDFDGNFSVLSDTLVLPVGTEETDPSVPPSVPTDLAGETSTLAGQTVVDLTWTDSSSPVSVSGYNIYRNNDYLTTVFSNSFTETVESGAAFFYSVAAFDSFGDFSACSRPLSLLGDENQPPFFSDLADQNLPVGVVFEQLLRPVDIDGSAAGILVSALPVGMDFVGNRGRAALSIMDA